jgi:TRAP-type C4-dicarboxylate transport system permease small subunit
MAESSSESPLGESVVERACRGLCELALAAMVLLTSAEVVARQFHFSFELVDEIGGYLLAALTFLSLPVALVGGAFHQVEYVRARLGPRGRAALGLVFTLMSLLFALVLAWQLWRLVTRSYGADVRASTILGTPLWLPQSAMLLGTGALIVALLRVLARQWRTLRTAERARA